MGINPSGAYLKEKKPYLERNTYYVEKVLTELFISKGSRKSLSEKKALEDSEEFCNMHGMSEVETKEHMEMVIKRLEKDKEEFAKMNGYFFDQITLK
jgi:hypothetical protein